MAAGDPGKGKRSCVDIRKVSQQIVKLGTYIQVQNKDLCPKKSSPRKTESLGQVTKVGTHVAQGEEP